MEDRADEKLIQQPQHKIHEKQNKKAMSKFQLSIMIKIGTLLGLAILIVGVMNNLIIFYSFGHIMKISQHQFLDNEQFALNSLNYQQSRIVSNQVQMLVTAIHQLNKVNDEQISSVPISTDFQHCYPTDPTLGYKDIAKQRLNCICHTASSSTECQYQYPTSPNYFDPIPDCTVTSSTTTNWYEVDYTTKATSRTSNQYLYFAASYPNSDANFSQQQYNQIRVMMQYKFQEFYRIARPIYKSMRNYIDYIRITHQTGVEMFYSEKDVSSKYKCNYSTRDNTIYKKTVQYKKTYSKDLVEIIYIDETESSADRKIKTEFCLTLNQMAYCEAGVDIPCGQICIQSSIQFSLIKKILNKSIIIDTQEYFLIGSQENSNYQVLNKQNVDSTGKMISFQWLYTTLFNYLPSQTVTQYVIDFSSKFGGNFYPYSSSKTKQQFEAQNQGFGEYYTSSTDANSFSYSYVRVNQDYEDSTTHKIIYTLFSQFDSNDSLARFQYFFDKESKLNQNWILVGVITGLSLICCYLFLNSFAFSIANPIIELTSKVKQIKEGNLDINLLVDFKYSFEEVNLLYEELEEVNLQIKYSTDKFYDNKSDAENLVNLTNAVRVYQDLKNQKILGIIFNNLGNIHARNQRYQEAIGCFRKAVKIAEKELRLLVRFDYPEVFYKAKRVQGWQSYLQYREPVSPLGWLDENEKIFIVNNQKQVRVNMKLKKKLEEVFCNRLFSLANAILLYGELEQNIKTKLIYFEEAIDHLNLVDCIDRNLSLARTRSIKINFRLSQAYINRAKLSGIQEDWFEGIGQLEKATTKFNTYESIHNIFRVELLKRKFQRNQEDENLSVRKSRISSNLQSTMSQTQRVHAPTDDSLSKYNTRRNNPMQIEMHQFYSPNINQYNSSPKKRTLPDIVAKYHRCLNEEETELEVIVDDPPEILKSELEMVKGQVHYEFGIYNKSMDHCTSAIEEGKYFNPDIRRECLKILQNIFELQIVKKQQKIEKESKDSTEYVVLDKMILDFQKVLKIVKHMIQDCEVKGKKDLIFLVDVSETMNKNRTKAIESFSNIRDNYIKQHDRLALIKFNHNIDVCFELQESGKDDKFVDKFLKDAKHLPCSGDKALYNAIYEGIKLFQKAEPQPNSRWLVTITDDVDNYSRIDEEQLKPLFFQNNVKLIVIGLNLKNSAIKVFQKLCKSTGGTFIENSESTDFNVAFQSITNLQFGTDQQANYVDEKFD